MNMDRELLVELLISIIFYNNGDGYAMDTDYVYTQCKMLVEKFNMQESDLRELYTILITKKYFSD